MQTPSMPSNEPDRLQALQFLEILDSAAETCFDRVTELASMLLEVPICAISLIDADRQWFKSIQGLDVAETSRDVSFCGHAILDCETLVVEDALADDRFADNPLVAGDPEIRFYAGHPISTEDGHRVGTLCVIDRQPRKIDDRQLQMIRLLAGIVENELRTREKLRRSTSEIERVNQDAVRLAERKATFVTHMSHEIRTPMMSILGYANLLAKDCTSARDRIEYAGIIESSGEHLLALVNDILDHAKVEAGRMDVDKIPVMLAPFLADVRRLMRIRAEEKGLSLRLGNNGAIPGSIETDPVRLRQVLVNLVGNAIKFTASGFVEIMVQLEGDKLGISVRDTGIGMSPAQTAKVFDPFSQAEADTARKYGGTGLGLAISKQLADYLGGDLVVESQQGIGSVFRLRIDPGPLEGAALLETIDVEEPRARVREERDVKRSFGGKVLLAEDDVVNRALMSKILTGYDVEIETVGDGASAVAAVLDAAGSGSPFDLVIMDMLMPVVDGYAATSQLREGGYRGPIVALTGNIRGRDRDKCLESGCDDYLAKPIDLQALEAVLERFSRE